MKYEEIYTRSIDQPEAFGQHRPMKLNGIVNRNDFVERWKWISTWYKDAIEYLLSHIRQAFKMDMIKPPLFMIPSNTNYKKYTYSEVKPK
jgi:hypothetical protein